MSYTLLMMATFWRHRARVFWPVLLLPLVLIAIQVSQNTAYMAVTTLQLDAENIHSPLLKNISQQGHREILKNTLTSRRILADTTKETGMILNKNQFDLTIISDDLLQLSLKSTTQNGLAQVLDAHAFNFIMEVLSPERFRLAQQISATELEMSALAKRIKTTKGKVLKQRLATQKRLLDETYKELLKKSQSIDTTSQHTRNSVLWFAEPSRVLASVPLWQKSMVALNQGVIAGLVIGLLLILLHYMLNTTFRKDADITNKLGLKVIGHLPYFGTVRLNRGTAAVDMPHATKGGTHHA